MIVNRVADLTFTAGVICTFYVFQSAQFDIVFALAPFFQQSTISFFNLVVSPVSLICLLLFFGAMGKSAQIGLHT
jgi:NADH-quinone oxidoreductase subunit L